ncbi:hypothetical protein L3Y34_011243 [Caenorhabditis briggsae]|uniref:Uncharacterized protein n=1 Tax=Caenorhabditis briggsae TaxID=6238 RepID=A0AAE8ZLB6_CAEBR|nr:hypothetical protein L3Y34_011243 [Caenorhabditis briggsae]
MGTNGGVIAAQSMEIETNENPEKVAEPVVRRKRVTRRRHRRIHSKNNCLTPPNSDDDVSVDSCSDLHFSFSEPFVPSEQCNKLTPFFQNARESKSP